MATSVQDLATLLGGRLRQGDGARIIEDIAQPETGAHNTAVVLFAETLRTQKFSRRAGLLVVPTGRGGDAQTDGALMEVDEPRAALARLLQHFRPEPQATPGIHASAVVSETAIIGRNVSVGPLAVVESGAELGPDCVIGAQSYVGPDVVIGAETTLEPGVRILARSRLGARVHVGAGTVVGSEGFGHLAPDEDGTRLPMPQAGGVTISNGVRIGALCCIDRGSVGDTSIGENARLDNLVQVGHNSIIERDAVLVAQVGISGSVRVGRGAVLAGQSGVADHREVGAEAVLLARAAAFRDVPPGAVYGGVPARPKKQWMSEQARLSRLTKNAAKHNKVDGENDV